MDERELRCPPDRPLIGWRLFRARPSSVGFMLSAPLIHDPVFESAARRERWLRIATVAGSFEGFPSRAIESICYEREHPAPAPGCRCGLYAAVEGTLDSLTGYLHDSAHDGDPPVYAEVACSGRVFLDARGVRAQRMDVLRLATSVSVWPDPGVYGQAIAELGERYGVEVGGLDSVPDWVLANAMPQGAPPEESEDTVDLDALLVKLGMRQRH